MRVPKKQRKLSMLLMLHYRKVRYDAGEIEQSAITAYTMARWQGIAQSNTWLILQELCKSRFVNRHKSCGKSVIITYTLTHRGQAHVDRHVLECVAANTFVHNYRVDKNYQRLAKRFEQEI